MSDTQHEAAIEAAAKALEEHLPPSFVKRATNRAYRRHWLRFIGEAIAAYDAARGREPLAIARLYDELHDHELLTTPDPKWADAGGRVKDAFTHACRAARSGEAEGELRREAYDEILRLRNDLTMVNGEDHSVAGFCAGPRASGETPLIDTHAPIIEGLLTPQELADWQANLTNPETWEKVKRLAEEMLRKLRVEHPETGERDPRGGVRICHNCAEVTLSRFCHNCGRKEQSPPEPLQDDGERPCEQCGKLILVPGRSYEIAPEAVCRCGRQDGGERELDDEAITLASQALAPDEFSWRAKREDLEAGARECVRTYLDDAAARHPHQDVERLTVTEFRAVLGDEGSRGDPMPARTTKAQAEGDLAAVQAESSPPYDRGWIERRSVTAWTALAPSPDDRGGER